MAPAADFEYQNPCIICRAVCGCVTKSDDHNSDTEMDGNRTEIISKGQSVLTTALRSLRWNRLTTTSHSNETVLNQEKCRPIISLKEVADHDSYDDCWIVLYDRVYDVTKFLHEHPAGHDVILEYGGRDATTAFRGHSQFAMRLLKQYEIGELPEKERIYRVAGRLRCDELPE